MSDPSRPPGRLSNFLHSIRLRLSLWFALVLALALLVFSVFVYYREAQAIHIAAEARLSDQLHRVNDFLRGNIAREHPEELPQYLPGGQVILQKTDELIFADPSGTVLQTWGPASQQQAAQFTQLAIQSRQHDTVTQTLTPASGASHDPQTYLFAASPLLMEGQAIGWVVLGQPADPEGQLTRLALTLGLAGLLTLLVAILGGYWLADRALRPVQDITRTAQQIGETDLSRRLNLRTRDELGQLANTFDRMLDRLEAAFARQRQFTADASHELRTPLTIIGLETSRALSGGRPQEEYQRTLQVIQSENEIMTRLVNELLTLARLDAGQVTLKAEPVDLSDVALEVAERYSVLAAKKGIEVQTGELPDVEIKGDRQYLIQMIGNLLDNAIKYSTGGPGQWVRVETGERDSNGKQAAWVRVTDNGAGISAEHLPHLFDRFYRIDAARSRNEPEEASSEGESGSGLGLAIVEWIARLHNGRVTVESEPGKGSSFEIELAGL